MEMHTEYKNVAQELLTVSVFGTTEVWCKADDPASVTILIASFHLVPRFLLNLCHHPNFEILPLLNAQHVQLGNSR